MTPKPPVPGYLVTGVGMALILAGLYWGVVAAFYSQDLPMLLGLLSAGAVFTRLGQRMLESAKKDRPNAASAKAMIRPGNSIASLDDKVNALRFSAQTATTAEQIAQLLGDAAELGAALGGKIVTTQTGPGVYRGQ